MRKFLPLMLILMVFIGSCKSALDKTINKDNFVKDCTEIEQNYSDEYADADFVQLRMDILLGGVIYGETIKGTYRDSLDAIKAARLKRSAELKK
jgi:hypothetical protein